MSNDTCSPETNEELYEHPVEVVGLANSAECPKKNTSVFECP